MSDDEIQRRLSHIADKLDENTRAIGDIDKSMALVKVDVGYLKQRVTKKETDEAEAERLRSSRRFSVLMAIGGGAIGVVASVVTAILNGGGNASQ